MSPQGLPSHVETETTAAPATPESRLELEWFAGAERISAPPSSSKRPKVAGTPPPDPIGDSMADAWFR